jgi:hypothetical protein
MTRRLALALAVAAALTAPASGQAPGKHARVEVPAGIDHAPWNRLLQKYVDGRGLVDYAAWKASPEDREALAAYVARFAPAAEPARGDERAASLINAYNALTIGWMLGQYPVGSIRSTSKPFDGRRHELFGRKVSLDDIEHGTLRPDTGFRVHAAISCASRSCPPLSARAWEAAGLDERLDAAMRAWLGREDLNRFLPDRRKAEISAVFKWFAEDFEKAGGVRKLLSQFGPDAYRAFLSGGNYAIGYLSYDWGLNDQGKEGRDYGGLRSLWDRL